MTEPTSAVATQEQQAKAAAVERGRQIDSQIAVKQFGGLDLTTLPEMNRFAQWVVESKMCPPCYEKPGQVVIAIQTGAETGLTPMASVRSIYVVPGSGMPSWRAEAIRALIRRGFQDPYTHKVTPVFHPGTDLEEGVFHDHPETGLKKDCKDTCYGWTKSWPKVKNGEMVETRFSVGHAKQAGLWNNDKRTGWKNNPDRMLMHRSTAFHGRDYYGGILLGLMSQDEAEEVSAGSVPRLRHGVIDSEQAAGKGDPLFTPQEANTDVVDIDGNLSASVTEAPEGESAGPLFEAEQRDRRGVPVDPFPERKIFKSSDVVDGEIVDDDPFGVNEPERDPETGEIIPDEVGQ